MNKKEENHVENCSTKQDNTTEMPCRDTDRAIATNRNADSGQQRAQMSPSAAALTMSITKGILNKVIMPIVELNWVYEGQS